MSDTKHGGPAFPPTPYEVWNTFGTSSGSSETHSAQRGVAFAHGMSLRDYFAAHAMHGLLMDGHDNGEADLEHVAKRCYFIADAMLKERAK